MADIIAEADRLYEADKPRDNYNLLKAHVQSDDAEVLWRFARAARCLAAVKETPADEKKSLVHEGFLVAQKSIELAPACGPCHKYVGILMKETSDYGPVKDKIAKAYDIQAHFKKAIELTPSDPYTHYLLGNWCFAVAETPWYQRKIASALFATPPTSTFEEALSHFLKAEEVSPNFYFRNHLMIGKCYMNLKDKEKSKEWLRKASINPDVKSSDLAAKEEAISLLS